MNTDNALFSALVVDDESLARASICMALKETPDWQVVGECDRGDQVIELVSHLSPDVIFLDIKMPGMSGLSVCQQLQQFAKPPLVVFVTAYDAHAIEAFELCALDYLLKPFDDQRFNKTLGRVETLLKLNQNQQLQVAQLQQLANESASPLKHLVVRSVGKIQLIEVDTINWLSTAGNYVELHLDEQVILHRVSLSYLENYLGNEDFVRIHRTAMVRMSLISEFLTLTDGQYAVSLKNGERVSVSASYKETLLKRLGVE